MEGQNLEIRQFLHKYESVIEGQRQKIGARRQAILTGETPCSSELERLVSLATIDDLWSEYLAAITDLREGVHTLPVLYALRDTGPDGNRLRQLLAGPVESESRNPCSRTMALTRLSPRPRPGSRRLLSER